MATKITTWNVNGIRAALGKGLKEWVLAQAPDIMCLQEIKAKTEQLTAEQIDFPGYGIVWNPAERPGYSGVATMSRQQPESVFVGLDESRFDVEGRTICTQHPGFFLYNNYFPNGQRGHDRVEYKLDFYARLLEICDGLHAAGEKIIITGDFNTAHMPIDLAHPAENQETSGFMPEEREWVTRFLEHGFVDAYRVLYPERVQYTWWTYRMAARQRNIGWRIDYFLVSASLMPFVKDVIIHDDVMGSDHCPVSLILDDIPES
ncbi:MAG: exodeoxyribonuclease III [Chloroflexi bacterium HGW-Chloroflexi-6]|nr:MAG: exodeoxyribonuclease III [Chloroflexi bacterium HGW-Chloroflexi-6]